MILGYNSGINNTLKEKLFINPTPLHQTKDEFFILHNRIFPGKVQFIAFLDTSEEQQKKELAKDILLRLCYESNFAPVYELLLNVLNLEEKLSSDNYNYHVGRDHFIHLVNLYLLGIYTFFYNIEFYSKIYNQFHLNRNSNFNENLKLNAIKDFISSWKYFVLYHDLAYPFEYFGSDIDERLKKLNIEVLKDIRSDVFKLYDSENFRTSFIFELCIKSISKLIIVNRELKYLNNDFKNIYYHLEQKLIDKQIFKKDKKFLNVEAEEFNSICKENYKKDIYKLENIHTGESLKYILSVYKKSDLIYIVSNVITGHIIAVAFPNEDKHIIYFTEQYKNNIKFANLLSENPEMFFNDELLINDIYIDYYILNPIDKFNAFLKKVAVCEDVPQRSITRNNINLIFSSVLDKENDSTIISDVDFLDYSYKFYKKLREIILADKDYSYSYFATQKEVYNKHVKDIKSSFIEYCTKLTKNSLLEVGELEEYTKTGDEDVKDIISKWTKNAIDKIRNINWDKESNETEKDSIVSNLIKDFSIKLQARLTLNKIRDCILEKIKNNLKSIESNFYIKDIIKNDIIINDEVIKNFNKDIIQEINNKIKKSFEDSEFDICKLISNYKVEYSKYDHGIYGLKIFDRVKLSL